MLGFVLANVRQHREMFDVYRVTLEKFVSLAAKVNHSALAPDDWSPCLTSV